MKSANHLMASTVCGVASWAASSDNLDKSSSENETTSLMTTNSCLEQNILLNSTYVDGLHQKQRACHEKHTWSLPTCSCTCLPGAQHVPCGAGTSPNAAPPVQLAPTCDFTDQIQIHESRFASAVRSVATGAPSVHQHLVILSMQQLTGHSQCN